MIVKSRRLDVEIPKLPTVPAVALVFCSLKSRTFEAVPSINTRPVKTFRCVDRSISVAAAEEVSVVSPPTVKIPVCAKPPVAPPAPVKMKKLLPIVDAPKIRSLASVTATSLSLVRLTAPRKLFNSCINSI